jgi:hypothetical protein
MLRADGTDLLRGRLGFLRFGRCRLRLGHRALNLGRDRFGGGRLVRCFLRRSHRGFGDGDSALRRRNGRLSGGSFRLLDLLCHFLGADGRFGRRFGRHDVRLIRQGRFLGRRCRCSLSYDGGRTLLVLALLGLCGGAFRFPLLLDAHLFKVDACGCFKSAIVAAFTEPFTNGGTQTRTEGGHVVLDGVDSLRMAFPDDRLAWNVEFLSENMYTHLVGQDRSP